MFVNKIYITSYYCKTELEATELFMLSNLFDKNKLYITIDSSDEYGYEFTIFEIEY